jgi:hypothetical protein
MSDWKTRLLVTTTGSPRPLLANAITALREAPAWFGVLAYDEFSRETVIKSAPPWDIKLKPWSERACSSHDDLLTTEWLQREDIAVNNRRRRRPSRPWPAIDPSTPSSTICRTFDTTANPA